MISGTHLVIYSADAEADRAFLRDVLGLPWVDAGDGWLIFAAPPAELAIHPAEGNDGHEMFFICDDVEATVRDLGSRGIDCSPVHEAPWGRLTRVTLPGGGMLGIYQPRHRRPAAE